MDAVARTQTMETEMIEIVKSIKTQVSKTGCVKSSTLARAEKYLAQHPMSECTPLGMEVRKFINAMKAA